MLMFLTMLPLSALVKHVEIDSDYCRFYAEAEATLFDEIGRAELQLIDVDSSVHAAPLFNPREGVNTFYISGIGASPFEIGETIPILYFSRELNSPKRRAGVRRRKRQGAP